MHTTIKILTQCAFFTFFLMGCAAQKQSVLSDSPLPAIVAHRAGTADYPENTLLAIQEALRNHANMLWLTVQVSREGVPVLYRPADLSALTNGNGPVSAHSVAELQALNAGWNFKKGQADGKEFFPYRSQSITPIPTLSSALAIIPSNIPIILDLKALPADTLAQAVSRVLDQAKAWSRVMLYSTDAAFQAAFQNEPRAKLFESRDATRGRLIDLALARQCVNPPPAGTWVGMEYKRNLEVKETFTLGQGISRTHAQLWTADAVACFRSRSAHVPIIVFGINTEADYRAVACMGVNAVLADSPMQMKTIQAAIKQQPQCL